LRCKFVGVENIGSGKGSSPWVGDSPHRHAATYTHTPAYIHTSLSTGRTAVLETGPLQLLEPKCGTVCRQT